MHPRQTPSSASSRSGIPSGVNPADLMGGADTSGHAAGLGSAASLAEVEMSGPGAHDVYRGLMVHLFAIAALTSLALAQEWPGQPPTTPEVRAAMDKADAGDPSELLRLADAGRSDAQYFAGGMLILGRPGIATDPRRGCSYEEKAAPVRADAAHLVGECYRRGLAGVVDKDKAQAAYTRAIEMGYPNSKCVLGEMLFADPSQAQRGLALCKDAAQAGNANAQAEVGDLYYRGSGPIKTDHTEARRWYEMAAKQKQPVAARMLGQMYAKGDGGKRDAKKAMEWWKVAEAGGDPMVSILVADKLFSDISGGKPPGPGKFAFRGGIPVNDIEVIEDWYRQARDKDPRPDVKQRATYALSVLAHFKQAAQATATKP
jgi:TPR repeat protein